jgi:hypothetical protein
MLIKLMRTREWMEPGEVKCSICWQSFYLGEVSSVAVSDDEMEIGEVCWACVKAGPERMQARLDAHAEISREIADEAQRIASEGVDYVLTVEELLLAEVLYSTPLTGMLAASLERDPTCDPGPG